MTDLQNLQPLSVTFHQTRLKSHRTSSHFVKGTCPHVLQILYWIFKYGMFKVIIISLREERALTFLIVPRTLDLIHSHTQYAFLFRFSPCLLTKTGLHRFLYGFCWRLRMRLRRRSFFHSSCVLFFKTHSIRTFSAGRCRSWHCLAFTFAGELLFIQKTIQWTLELLT